MSRKGANVSLSSYDDIFSTEQSRTETGQEHVQEIPVEELHPFEEHPFKVLDDEEMALMDEEQTVGMTQNEETKDTETTAETAAPGMEKEKETNTAEKEPAAESTAEKQEDKKSGNILPAVILLLAVVIGGGVFAFMKLKGKKEQEKEKPDPDDEYQDEGDEEYLIPDDFEDQEEDMEENQV